MSFETQSADRRGFCQNVKNRGILDDS